jgi:hypothetical protein
LGLVNADAMTIKITQHVDLPPVYICPTCLLTQRPTKSTRSGREDEGVTKDHYEGKLPEIALAGLKALEAKSHNEEKQ